MDGLGVADELLVSDLHLRFSKPRAARVDRAQLRRLLQAGFEFKLG